MIPIIRGMIRKQRRQRVELLLEQIEVWEEHGRGLLSALLEVTDPAEELAQEVRRLLRELDR